MKNEFYTVIAESITLKCIGQTSVWKEMIVMDCTEHIVTMPCSWRENENHENIQYIYISSPWFMTVYFVPIHNNAGCYGAHSHLTNGILQHQAHETCTL